MTEATADIHFALLLAVARRVVEGDQLVRAGVFPGAQSAHLLGSWVHGRTIGLIGGGGRIGKAVAKRAQGFSMRTLYWTPRRKPEAEERDAGLAYVPYDQLLAESDFVSVHAPLNAGDAPPRRRARAWPHEADGVPRQHRARPDRGREGPGARAARSAASPAPASTSTRTSRWSSPSCSTMKNVVLTPHLGSAVTELREAMANVVVDNIMAVLEGRQPPNCWNPEIYSVTAT